MENQLIMENQWSVSDVQKIYDACEEIANKELKLDYYPNQIEIISSETMLDAYTSVGMPVNYNHWSFGKEFINQRQQYKKGRMGLAFEIVINSNPCISYIMEDNTAVTTAITIAHACFGHNHFFKNNYLFKEWTDASSIIDYLLFAKHFISECEEKYGIDAVEEILDACHALQTHAVNKYRRPKKYSLTKEKAKQKERNKIIQKNLNMLWEKTIPKDTKYVKLIKFPEEPQENILYFLEKNSPKLEMWQREIIRIVRKVSEYFYPQRQTKIMNEGTATFVHYYIINRLHDKGLLTDGAYLEFLNTHTEVISQQSFKSRYYNGLNPYAIGFAMFQDIKRICQNPTKEDREWFPKIANSDWIETIHYIINNYKDDSFIQQFLSPKIIRDFKLFSIKDDSESSYMNITNIHDNEGYLEIRDLLANQYDIDNIDPNIQITNIDLWGNRTMNLVYHAYNKNTLDEISTIKTLNHIATLWKFTVYLTTIDESTGEVLESFSNKGKL
jgi:stage V sporulation protein R